VEILITLHLAEILAVVAADIMAVAVLPVITAEQVEAAEDHPGQVH
jgi:hypothetical protein